MVSTPDPFLYSLTLQISKHDKPVYSTLFFNPRICAFKYEFKSIYTPTKCDAFDLCMVVKPVMIDS